MPKGYKPAVFVSSTCYDLSQIRADIKEFLESLGLDPVLSEFPSFLVNPSQDTVNNCIETVKQKADIFLLIVGGRYGSQHKSGRSITNLEYIHAKAKGVPIYVFVSKSILDILPVWHTNKDGDFSTVVDTPKLFEFVDSLRNSGNNWVSPFESAQDIRFILKEQIPYLFMDCLDLSKKLTKLDIELDSNKFSPHALQILIEKGDYWEYKLFGELLKNYIERLQEKRRDLQYQITFGDPIIISDPRELLVVWNGRKLRELQSYIIFINYWEKELNLQ